MTLVVVSHENATAEFRVEATVDNVTAADYGSVALSLGQQWKHAVNLTMNSAGDHEVQFLIYKDNSATPYLKPLLLWISVNPPGQ